MVQDSIYKLPNQKQIIFSHIIIDLTYLPMPPVVPRFLIGKKKLNLQATTGIMVKFKCIVLLD